MYKIVNMKTIIVLILMVVYSASQVVNQNVGIKTNPSDPGAVDINGKDNPIPAPSTVNPTDISTIATPPTTLAPTTITTTTTTTTTTTAKPITTTQSTTSTSSLAPNNNNTTTTSSTTTSVPTSDPSSHAHDRHFDGPSFIGGIILAAGLTAVGFVGWKFYKIRTERNYHTL